MLITGLIAARARGWPILGFLQGGAENWVLAALVIYLSIVPLIFLLFLPKGRAYRKALEDATAIGALTPALRAAIKDPVGAARAYEVAMIGVLALLTITKSF